MASCAPLAESAESPSPAQGNMSGRVGIRNYRRGVGIPSETDLGGGQSDEKESYGRGREKGKWRGWDEVRGNITNGYQGRAKGGVQIGTKKRIMTGQPGTGRTEEGFGVQGKAEKKIIMGCRNRLAMGHPVNHRELR